MLVLNAKRGVESTLERIFAASGNKFSSLSFKWTGSTAAIAFKKDSEGVKATVVFPAVDENAEIDNRTFTNLIGYALHELGHAWFTSNIEWDIAARQHGQFVHQLINGLEDPRIERRVIKSKYAPNAAALFENLVNSILDRDGYVSPDDKRNIPFLLAIEGRRLNGYNIKAPSIVDASPYAEHLHWALREAHRAKDTRTICEIAIELFKRLKEQDSKPKEPEPNPEQQESQEPQEGEGQGEGQSEGEGQQGEEQESEGQEGEGENEGEGQQGENEETQGEQTNREPSDQRGGNPTDWTGGRPVEPTDFINKELEQVKCAADKNGDRPAVGKIQIATFDWE